MFIGTNFNYITEFPTFFYTNSKFKSTRYNFIIPKVTNPNQLTWDQIHQLIQKEKLHGKEYSIYVNETIQDQYPIFLNQSPLLGKDTYIHKKVDKKHDVILPEGYSLNSDYDLDEVIKVIELCTHWSEERIYNELYEKYKTTGQENRIFEKFCIRYHDKIVGVASIVIDKKLNLGYFHNDGILEKHRRKGLHTTLINARNNYCLEQKITDAVAIVDENANSLPSYIKSGFREIDKFYIYSMNK